MVLAVWLGRAEPRPWVRRLGYLALAAVITQGILGGITVLWYLPDRDLDRTREPCADRLLPDDDDRARDVARDGQRATTKRGPGSRMTGRCTLERIAIVTTIAIYVQILIGATMRHTGAGLAIPDFPLSFGHLIPPHWDPKIAIHFAHRVGAR